MSEYKFGAMLPPDLAWQEDKTAGEIASINLISRLEARLKEIKDPSQDDLDLMKAIHAHLAWYGVRPFDVTKS